MDIWRDWANVTILLSVAKVSSSYVAFFSNEIHSPECTTENNNNRPNCLTVNVLQFHVRQFHILHFHILLFHALQFRWSVIFMCVIFSLPFSNRYIQRAKFDGFLARFRSLLVAVGACKWYSSIRRM